MPHIVLPPDRSRMKFVKRQPFIASILLLFCFEAFIQFVHAYSVATLQEHGIAPTDPNPGLGFMVMMLPGILVFYVFAKLASQHHCCIVYFDDEGNEIGILNIG